MNLTAHRIVPKEPVAYHFARAFVAAYVTAAVAALNIGADCQPQSTTADPASYQQSLYQYISTVLEPEPCVPPAAKSSIDTLLLQK